MKEMETINEALKGLIDDLKKLEKNTKQVHKDIKTMIVLSIIILILALLLLFGVTHELLRLL